MTVAEVAALTGVGMLTLSLITALLKGRAWAESRFVAREPCEARHDAVQRSETDTCRKLDRVHERLDVMQADTNEIKVMMARIETRTDIFAGIDKLISRLDARTGGA